MIMDNDQNYNSNNGITIRIEVEGYPLFFSISINT